MKATDSERRVQKKKEQHNGERKAGVGAREQRDGNIKTKKEVTDDLIDEGESQQRSGEQLKISI